MGREIGTGAFQLISESKTSISDFSACRYLIGSGLKPREFFANFFR
jgi:hypothetical protein